MPEPTSADAIARTVIAQCRREIAAAWEQIEAARDTLRKSRWMVARWKAQLRSHENSVRLPDRRRDDMFIPMPERRSRRRSGG